MMRFTGFTILGLAMASLSIAQTTTTLFIPDNHSPVLASIIASDSTATTYAFRCKLNEDCGWDGVKTLTNGPKTVAITVFANVNDENSASVTGVVTCSLGGTTSAVCVTSLGGLVGSDPVFSTETLTGTELPYVTVTLTSSVLANSSLAPSTTSASTNTQTSLSAGGSASGSGSVSSTSSTKDVKATTLPSTGTSTVTAKTGSSGTAGTATSTSSSKAGMPAITGNAKMVLGGMAVAMAIM